MLKRAVFLDRDGVIIKDKGYISSPEQVELFSGVAKAIAKINAANFLVIVVTNQSGIARGFFDFNDLDKVNDKMFELLQIDGARIDDLYFCPHHPQGDIEEYAKVCNCRKPETGLILQAAQEHEIELANSFLVGDSLSDVEAGRKAGCQTILIEKESSRLEDFDGKIVNDLVEAADHVLEQGAGNEEK